MCSILEYRLTLHSTDTSKRVLGKTATWREKKVLGSAKFANDITVTHCDADYMRNHYEMEYNEEQAVSELGGKDQSSRMQFAKKNFKPMYLIKMYPDDLTSKTSETRLGKQTLIVAQNSR